MRELDDTTTASMIGPNAPTENSELYARQLDGAVSDLTEDATAYSGRAAGFYSIANPVWDVAADDDACLAWGRASARQLMARSMGTNYVNEQSDSGSNVAENAYDAAKYRRLATLLYRKSKQAITLVAAET